MYLIIYLIPILLVPANLGEDSIFFIFLVITIGVYGAQGVIQYYIPYKIGNINRRGKAESCSSKSFNHRA